MGNFFKILDRACGLSMMAGPRRQLAIVHGPQFPLIVWVETATLNASNTHWQRSTSRQRTTPCTAGIGQTDHER
jgi:hypothetical protein